MVVGKQVSNDMLCAISTEELGEAGGVSGLANTYSVSKKSMHRSLFSTAWFVKDFYLTLIQKLVTWLNTKPKLEWAAVVFMHDTSHKLAVTRSDGLAQLAGAAKEKSEKADAGVS